MNKRLFLLCMPGLLTMVSACNGILEDLYDTPPEETNLTTGFRPDKADTRRGEIYINVVSYKEWTYLDLHQRTTQTLPIPESLTGEWDGRSGWKYYQVTLPSTFRHYETIPTDAMPTPPSWDIALHHYDVRTNDGEVLETTYTSIDQLLKEGNRETLLAQSFTPDTWTEHFAYYDLTGIYNYYIGYTQTWCNLALTRWMDMNVENHPPTYTLSGKVYLVRLADKSVAALHFKNYMSPTGAKGYVTIDYLYPY